MSVSLDFLLVADYAEAINGKIYIQGGGWDQYFVNDRFPAEFRLGIAIGLRVPWDETNRNHELEVSVHFDDVHAEVGRIEAKFEVGRPAGIAGGSSQFLPLGFNVPVSLPAGQYAVVATLGGETLGRASFGVVPGPMLSGRS